MGIATPLLSSQVLPQQGLLLLTVTISITMMLVYLHRQDRLDSLRSLIIPLTLFVVFGTLDTLITMSGTWDKPWQEGNPLLRQFLLWGGWWGQCIGTALWIISWSLLVDGFELLRRKQNSLWGEFFGWMRLLTLYALAIGHLDGYSSWAKLSVWQHVFIPFDYFILDYAPWLMDISPFGPPLYTGLVFGGLLALLHFVIERSLKNTTQRPESQISRIYPHQ